MSIQTFILSLISLNVRLRVHNGQLHFSDPGKALSPELLQEIKKRKAEIVNYLETIEQPHAVDPIEPLPPQDRYEVSHAQKRLWLLDGFEEAKAAYNMAHAYHFNKSLNVVVVQKVVDFWTDRHEVFRTTFSEQNGEPFQSILDKGIVRVPVDFIDLTTHLSADATCKEILNEDLKVCFDLSTVPLFRVKVIHLPGGRSVLYTIFHHIICDGWSLQVLLKEFSYLYNCYASGTDPLMQDLRVHYKEYAAWHNKQIFGSDALKHREFWKNTFADGVPKLDLPKDFRRPAIKSYKGKHLIFHLSRTVSEQVQQLSERVDTTKFMTLLSFVSVFLSRYSRQNDIVIGVPVAGREAQQLENQVGFFVNTLPLRILVDTDCNFNEFLREVKQLTLRAFDHQLYPFDQIVEDLCIERDMSRSPLFDVLVQLLNTNNIIAGASGLDTVLCEPYPLDNPTSQFDLCFNFTEGEAGISMDVEFATDLFQQQTIERMISQFIHMIEDVLRKEGNHPLNEIQLMSSEDSDLICTLLRGEVLPVPDGLTILDLFEEHVERNPESIAIQSETTSITYRELHESVNRLSNLLHEQSLPHGSVVAILLDKDIQAITAILAIMKAGCAYVAIEPALPFDRIKLMLDDCHSNVLITEQKHSNLANRLLWQCKHLHASVICDSDDAYDAHWEIAETEEGREAWDYIGTAYDDDIALGGWVSSYTGNVLSPEEMDEYISNTLAKLEPFLDKNSRVLEIGCASGLSMFRIAPLVKYYCGTDLSGQIIEKTRNKVKSLGINNIVLSKIAAHEIDRLQEDAFDIIIINSVIQDFKGHNYLRAVLQKSISLLGERGIIYCGDIQDLDKKDDLVTSLLQFKKANAGKGFLTKTNWSSELFLSRTYFDDLPHHFSEISRVMHSDKIGCIRNELTEFRFDVLLHVDKGNKIAHTNDRRLKTQFSRLDIQRCSAVMKSNATSHGPAYIVYTSGTTGIPKGVLVSHAALLNISLAWRKHYQLDTFKVRLLQFANLSFDVFIGDFCRALTTGGTLHFFDPSRILDVAYLYEVMRKRQINIFESTPGLIMPLMEYIEMSKLDFSFLRYVILGSDVLKIRDFNWLLNHFGSTCHIINSYGTTETTIDSSFFTRSVPLDELHDGNAPIGKPMINSQFFIVDDQFKPVPIGVPGELYIAGAGVAEGYLNNPTLTRERFAVLTYKNQKHRVYRTGDIARLLSDGNVQFMGRADQQGKIRGYRIEMQEVESVLDRCDLVRQSAARLVKGHDDSTMLVAYIVAKEKNINTGEVREYLKQHLPEYMIPSYILEVDRFPLSNNGKVQKNLLPHPDEVTRASQIDDKPSTEWEERLHLIWTDILGRTGIGINENFFEIGGHSLKAIQLVSRLQRESNIKLEIKDIFIYQTIKSLAARIDTLQWLTSPNKIQEEGEEILL